MDTLWTGKQFTGAINASHHASERRTLTEIDAVAVEKTWQKLDDQLEAAYVLARRFEFYGPRRISPATVLPFPQVNHFAPVTEVSNSDGDLVVADVGGVLRARRLRMAGGEAEIITLLAEPNGPGGEPPLVIDSAGEEIRVVDGVLFSTGGARSGLIGRQRSRGPRPPDRRDGACRARRERVARLPLGSLRDLGLLGRSLRRGASEPIGFALAEHRPGNGCGLGGCLGGWR
jgi:hypothetical protein